MAHFINKTMTANGSTNAINWRGGPGTFYAQSTNSTTWGGGTLKLEYSIDGSTWTPVPGTELSFIASDMGGFQIGPCELRVTLTGATNPSIKIRVVPAWQGWLLDNTIPTTS